METGYIEYMVRRLPQGKDWLLKIGIALAAIAVMAAGIIWAGMLAILIIGGVLAGVFFLYKQFEVEYEYILTDGQLDIDKIIAKERRKPLLTVEVSSFEIFAPMQPRFFASYEKTVFAQKHDVSSSPASPERWFAVYADEKGKTLLVLEPNQTIVQAVRRIIPRRWQGI